MNLIDFDESPFIVIWEVTRSCALKCVHCRAEALETRHPEELTTKEAFGLLEEIRRFGKPLLVLTGGDPMRRPDALDLVGYGAKLGLRMAMTPSGTDEMTEAKVESLKRAGLSRLAVSLDGSNAGVHDAFRKVPGSFGWTLDIIRWANEAGLSVQINTTITRHNLGGLDALCGLMESLKIVLWSVFFLVPVGRGRLEDEVSASDYEKVFHKMFELSLRSSFDVKSTEAPQYRRVVMQRGEPNASLESREWDGVGRAGKGVNAGKGFVFVSHTGEIFPSGFLPLSGGNVKRDSLTEVYRRSDLFREIRDASKLKGKCGVCEYKSVCGGSRSRAWAVYGDKMAADPFCVHLPRGYGVTDEEKRFW
ncbi:MAG: TIGR04053 family radical SAM/SPASM domain-containing protein [Candidatus Omnitrophica bacterium]|nr:TIGR04053 family radical SAM/SPASM domain-containing protein [Candidatus Omnitrophota bacterium]